MTSAQAIILGIVQGLTEFLPVSSSGHLVILQHLLGLTEPALIFDISVHVGTLVAVVVYFRSDLAGMATAATGWLLDRLRLRQVPANNPRTDPDIQMVLRILAGSLPTALIGLGLHQAADLIFSNPLLVGCMLLVTGSLLWLTRRIRENRGATSPFPIRTALGIGLVQGLAILPGISRSGATIAAGLLMGLDRRNAARFSFLLSIPAILGALALSLKDWAPVHPASVQLLLLGTATAGAVGYASLSLLVHIVQKGHLYYFAPYCWLLGIAAIILGR